MKSVRMKKNKAKQGIDACEFEVIFEKRPAGQSEQILKNSQNKEYGKIKVKEGKGRLVVIPSCFLRPDNVMPFGMADLMHLEKIKDDCMQQIEQTYGPIRESKLKSIECNITQEVSGQAITSDVLNMINLACLSPERDNIKYEGANKKRDTRSEIHTVIVQRNHYYVLKAYNKTQQMLKDGVSRATNIDSISEELLRVEIIMKERMLKRLFGHKDSISDIFTEDGLIKIFREYKRIFCEEIMDQGVHSYMENSFRVLVESLCETGRIITTIVREREIIPDKAILQKAIKKRQALQGVSDNSKRAADSYAKRCNLPQDVILTLRNFQDSCG